MKFVLLIALACLAHLTQAFLVVPGGAAGFSCSTRSSNSNVRSGAASITARPAVKKAKVVVAKPKVASITAKPAAKVASITAKPAAKKAKVVEEKPEEVMVSRKPHVVAAMAKSAGLNKTQAEAALVAFMETVIDTVADGGKINLQGFGTFEARGRKGRIGRNPRTGDPIDIKATTVPAFSASKPFKDQVKANHVD